MSFKECDYDEGDSWDDEHPFGMDPEGRGGYNPLYARPNYNQGSGFDDYNEGDSWDDDDPFRMDDEDDDGWGNFGRK